MHIRTEKQYYKEVIRLHYDYGYGEDRISRILPIGHSTVSRCLAIFAAENKGKTVQMAKTKAEAKTQLPSSVIPLDEVKCLKSEIARLQSQYKEARLRADVYEEMINVAEAKFKIPIRKKAGTNR